MRRGILILLTVWLISFQIGCDTGSPNDTANNSVPVVNAENNNGHSHGDGDALHWPKKDLEHNGYVISLGHHGNHWHANEEIEPAVAIVKDGEDIGDAKMTCQLMDGEEAIGSPVEMIFEPKTDAEPAHFAGAKLTFPDEKEYLVQFEITLPNEEEKFADSIEVTCGH